MWAGKEAEWPPLWHKLSASKPRNWFAAHVHNALPYFHQFPTFSSGIQNLLFQVLLQVSIGLNAFLKLLPQQLNARELHLQGLDLTATEQEL